jgi:hypothetical protein
MALGHSDTIQNLVKDCPLSLRVPGAKDSTIRIQLREIRTATMEVGHILEGRQSRIRIFDLDWKLRRQSNIDCGENPSKEGGVEVACKIIASNPCLRDFQIRHDNLACDLDTLLRESIQKRF